MLIFRIRLLSGSATYRLFPLSQARLYGNLKLATAAGPSLDPGVPVPATFPTVMIAGVTVGEEVLVVVEEVVVDELVVEIEKHEDAPSVDVVPAGHTLHVAEPVKFE